MTLALLAQLADLVTWIAFAPVEMNPLVRALGPLAVLAKLGLIFFLARTPFGPYRLLVIVVATVAGVLGALSNLP